MNRPYTVCHIFSALDGAITGSFMGLPECGPALREYGRLRSRFNCTSILYGTTTMLDFCEGYVSGLSKCKPVERTDYAVLDSSRNNFMIAIDRHGRLAYSDNYIERHGVKYYIVEVLTESVSDAYLNYLRKLGISYIFAGQSDLDCAICMEKLKTVFGIERLMIAGGGYIDWAFADSGMVDELSLVIAPAADGEDKVTVFAKKGAYKNVALSLKLKDAKKLDGNAVWLNYSFDNAMIK